MWRRWTGRNRQPYSLRVGSLARSTWQRPSRSRRVRAVRGVNSQAHDRRQTHCGCCRAASAPRRPGAPGVRVGLPPTSRRLAISVPARPHGSDRVAGVRPRLGDLPRLRCERDGAGFGPSRTPCSVGVLAVPQSVVAVRAFWNTSRFSMIRPAAPSSGSPGCPAAGAGITSAGVCVVPPPDTGQDGFGRGQRGRGPAGGSGVWLEPPLLGQRATSTVSL